MQLPSRKLRTQVELSQFLLSELGWRRKEIHCFESLVNNPKYSQQALLRAAIAMLYAHWEGYVKVASAAYIEHVRRQRCLYSDLKPNFVALGARAAASRAMQSQKWQFQIEFCEFVMTQSSAQAAWPKNFDVDTGSNLSPAVFRDIVYLLGIEYRPEFQVAEKPIIERLLDLRNRIAHGEYSIIDIEEYRQLNTKVEELLVLFCNQVDNAAATQHYRR